MIARADRLGPADVARPHHERMDDRGEGGSEPLPKAVFGIIVHQKPDRTAIHAVDRLRRVDRAVEGLQHQAVAAEGDDDVSLLGRNVAIKPDQRLQRLVGFLRAGGDKGDRPGRDVVLRGRNGPASRSASCLALSRGRSIGSRGNVLAGGRRHAKAAGTALSRSGFGQGPGRLARGARLRRQRDQEAGAAIEVVGLRGGELDRAAVAGDEIGGNRQAEPGRRSRSSTCGTARKCARSGRPGTRVRCR